MCRHLKRFVPFTDLLHFLFSGISHTGFPDMTILFPFVQLKERWQEEDSEIAFRNDRVESDDEDPDLASYTPRVDLEDKQPARASKDSDDDDDCCIIEPAAVKPLAYALPVGGPAAAPARTNTRQNAPLATKGKGKKAADKSKKKAPPALPAGRRAPRVTPVESG